MAENLLDFTGKTALITGGATGIGRATARVFGQQGANVVVADVASEAEETVDLIVQDGGTATFVETDVTDSDSVKNAVATAVNTYGGLDVAFNNAGVSAPDASVPDMDEEAFDKVSAVNLKGVFLALKHEVGYMKDNGGGAIVNTASIAGLIGNYNMSPYVASKHGVIGLTKATALEFADQNVRVNAVAPGLVATPMTQEWLDDPETRDKVIGDTPIGRAAEPEENGQVALYLASPLASFVTGTVLPVDGGQTAQ
ncbi:SDR family NAD(P)-dependent oxidoreductase [Auritidibacter sp. NML100628]|uniref:SDR family NAD(P)-dependent oxidoreductase n=1 Tax=Auritidibacter sp. NML100628 TaxID=2170742 RepID=UPI000D73B82B|nr:SDR family NAD(P)-dependent oxidoreductase [Auritidibacter sp. NML100628]PXA77381.1 short chain dehydrogenase [Auritidibacter sp. NML100628]